MSTTISKFLKLMLLFTFVFCVLSLLTSCFSTPEDTTPTIVSLSKTASHSMGRTASPGEKITYSITVKNDGTNTKNIVVKDSVPTNTTYVSGADSNENGALTWTLNIPAGESKSCTYTVKVNDDPALCDGGTVPATTVTVGDTTATTNDIYIERTINSFDARYIDIAIDAIASSTYKDRVYASWLYYIAFTQKAMDSNIYGGNFDASIYRIIEGVADDALLDAVAPTLYGGNFITDAIEGIKGAPTSKVLESDLVVGDIIITTVNEKTRSYVWGSNGLFEITEGCTVADKGAVLSSITANDAYVVLRPSTNLLHFTPTDVDATPDTLNEKQQALVDTAIYYLMRGEWLQYDDTYYCSNGVNEVGGNESRWEYALNAPEEYTSDNFGYINCAAFTHDVYWTVFGQKLPNGMYTTANLAANAYKNNMLVYKFIRNVTDTHTDEEKAQVTNEFLSCLQPGDLMVVRRATGSGHVMLYIGNGAFIHSTGSNYNYSGSYGVEVYEPTIRFHKVKDYFLDPTSTNGYIFGEKVDELHVVRPLKNQDWANYEITEVTQNRLANLKGIVAEKLSSVKESVSVNPGDEITYTIRINNTNASAVTLNVSDVVPEYTVYVSGGDTVNGNNLSWVVTIPARATVDITFTVKVADNAPLGAKIMNDGAKIGGVPFKTYHTIVNRTLTKAEQQTLIETFNAMNAEGNTLTGLAFVNELYKRAFGVENLFASTDLEYVYEDYENGVFTAEGLPLLNNGKQAHTLNDSGVYVGMVVDSLFGGRGLATGSQNNRRTQLANSDDLVVGDIFIGRTSSAKVIMLYIGNNTLVNLSTAELTVESVSADGRLERGPAYSYYYGVLRPSFIMN